MRLNGATLARPSEQTVSALAAAAIGEARREFLARQRRVRERADEESVHRARVALRKLRVYVRLFRSRIGRARSERLARELRWLFAAFGALREMQLFELEIAEFTRTSGSHAQAFAGRVQRRRAAAALELQARLVSERHERLCAELASIERTLAAQLDQKRAHGWLTRRLARMHKRLRADVGAALDAPASRHALRKRLKRFRYAAQLAEVVGAEHPKRSHRLRERTTALQDALGELQDLQVARALIRSLKPPKPFVRRLRAELAATGGGRESVLDDALEAFAEARSPWKW